MRQGSRSLPTLLCLLVMGWCLVASLFVARLVVKQPSGGANAAVAAATGDTVLAVRVENTADYYHLTRRELVNETQLPMVLVLPASVSRILAAHHAGTTGPRLCEFARHEVAGVRLN